MFNDSGFRIISLFNWPTIMLRDCFISIPNYTHYKIVRFKLQDRNCFSLDIYSVTHVFAKVEGLMNL